MKTIGLQLGVLSFITILSLPLLACDDDLNTENIQELENAADASPGDACSRLSCDQTDSAETAEEEPCTASMDTVDEIAGDACPDRYAAARVAAKCTSGDDNGKTIELGATGEPDGAIAYFSYSQSWGTHAKQCFYDLQTEALVGVLYCDDVPTFCGKKSSDVRFGSATSECWVVKRPEISVTCAIKEDAGV